MTKYRILVLSWEPWNGTNSFGNSYNAIFSGLDNLEIANISCRYGLLSPIVSKGFQFTEKSIILNLLGKEPAGYGVNKSTLKNNLPLEQNGYSNFLWKLILWIRSHRFIIIFWLRDLIWKTNRWKCKELDNFVDSFAPDILWIPVYYSNYMNDIALYLRERTSKKMISYISDDNYTFKQFSLSPLYWIDRLIKRPNIKKVIKKSEFLYVITEKQKEEYEKIFNIKCKLLWKGSDFNIPKPKSSPLNQPLKMVFMGNLGLNRWKSILDVINAIKILNKDSPILVLEIYTMTPLNNKIRNKLTQEGVSILMPNISSDKISSVFHKADILLHVEPLSLKYRLMYRLSFSTKLVDYFASARCIFAYGGETGSMDYLRRTNSAIVVNSKKELYNSLRYIVNSPKKIKEMGELAWNCGKSNHNLKMIQESLIKDIRNIID